MTACSQLFQRRRAAALILSCLLPLAALTACDDGDAPPPAGGATATPSQVGGVAARPPAAGEAPSTPPVTELVTALGRLADTENFRTSIHFADEAVLAQHAGSTGDKPVNWRDLAGRGSYRLRAVAATLPVYDVRPGRSDYIVTAGVPLGDVTLVAGGQDQAAVTGTLVAAGWRAGDGTLVAPPETKASRGSCST
ncbi:hypothetical protein [Dactylosporangium sp. NPDC000521]|uniref:hypothetical protein n=1 Tax=Dactylosporangium sp. NPDC000521 TaxID=3363975 RepID=UPI003698F744